MADPKDIPDSYELENADRAEESGVSGDDSKVRFRDDDLSEDTKQTIGQFMTSHIDDFNKISTNPGENDPGNFDSSPSPNSFLAADQTVEGVHNYEQIGKSGYFEKDTIAGRVENSETEINAHERVNQITTAQEIPDEIERTIDENAAHSPSENTPFIPEGNPSEDEAGTRQHIIQNQFGRHRPQKNPRVNPVERDDSGEIKDAIKIQDLKNLGTRILMEGSGEVFVPDDPTDPAQALGARSSAATVPSLARLGFRISTNRFSAEEVMSDVNGRVDDRPETNTDLSSLDQISYGNPNNPLVPFDAISSNTTSLVVGTLLIITVSELLKGLAELLSQDPTSNKPDIASPVEEEDSSYVESAKRRLGSFKAKEKEDASLGKQLGENLLGGFLGFGDLLIETDNDYSEAVRKGTAVFFGVQQNTFSSAANVAQTLGGAAVQLTESPGYYLGLLRTLVRAINDPFITIANGIANIAGTDVPGNAFDRRPGDVNPVVGLPADPTTSIESIRVIQESKLLKFMNIIASIGDVSLNSDIDSTIDGINSTMEDEDGEGQLLNPAALISKNRLSDRLGDKFDGVLAWGSNTLRSLYKVSPEIIAAESEFNSNGAGFGSLQGEGSFINNKTIMKSNRLSQDEVREIEDELDSYYCPFYFHDLRTNEVISFHAFIEDISDSFTAEYNESEGYGRVGKTYAWKNTNRDVSLSFKVVSTNEQDFDEMWYKINRLTMLLFPQYTRGRSVSFENNRFIQPFSQLPGNTPLIRLRVGDLIKSNYSDFDIARLHGLAWSDFKISGQNVQRNAKQIEREFRIRDNISKRIRNHEFQPRDRFKLVETGELIVDNRRKSAVNWTKPLVYPRENEAAIEAIRSARKEKNKPPVHIPANTTFNVIERIRSKTYSVVPDTPISGLENVRSFEISFENVKGVAAKPDEDWVIAQAREDVGSITNATPEETDEQNSAIQQFFEPDMEGEGNTNQGNPIMKAFETTRGQGLPGVMRNVSFDWSDAIWTTHRLNARAPNWITVQVDFAPVFDVNPGLDVNGDMIGPPFNIGEIMKRLKMQRRNRNNDEKEERFKDRQGGATYKKDEIESPGDTFGGFGG